MITVESITLQLLISDLHCCHNHCHCCLLSWSGPILQSKLMCWSRITKPSSRNSTVLTLLYTEGVIRTPIPTLKFSSNRKVWFSPLYDLGYIAMHWYQLWLRPRKCFKISTMFELCKLWQNDQKYFIPLNPPSVWALKCS